MPQRYRIKFPPSSSVRLEQDEVFFSLIENGESHRLRFHDYSEIYKAVMDADICGALQAFAAGVDLSENAQALDAVREVGPGNHYLGCEHTQRNFETAFYASTLADNKSFEQWSDEGAVWHQDREATLWRQMLKDYEPPPMDEAMDEALQAYMAKRREEIVIDA